MSSIWYRWFESGRNVRVSEQFIARLSNVLKLDLTFTSFPTVRVSTLTSMG
jgi:hypothetical protein